MTSKILGIFVLFLLSFTSSNPFCDHSRHINLFSPSNVKSGQCLSFIEMEDEIMIPGNKLEIFIPVKDTVTWKILNRLEYKEEEHPSYGTVMMPVFSNEVLSFDKKRIIIKGYILPVDRKTYALSKNVYAACFFCGKAGPETVMGLQFKQPPGRIKMDTYAMLSGILHVNSSDVEDWMYSLTDVEIIHMKE